MIQEELANYFFREKQDANFFKPHNVIWLFSCAFLQGDTANSHSWMQHPIWLLCNELLRTNNQTGVITCTHPVYFTPFQVLSTAIDLCSNPLFHRNVWLRLRYRKAHAFAPRPCEVGTFTPNSSTLPMFPGNIIIAFAQLLLLSYPFINPSVTYSYLSTHPSLQCL